MNLSNIEKAAKNAFALQDNVKIFIENDFDKATIDKELKDLLGKLRIIADGLADWKADNKNKGLLDTISTAKIKELLLGFETLNTTVGDKIIIQGKKLKYKDGILWKECERVCDEIGKKLDFFTPAKPQQLHYNAPHSKEKLKAIFEGLKKDGFIAADSDLADWLYICGVGEKKTAYKPINWLKNQNLLAWLIYELEYNNETINWKPAEDCFTVKGKKPNINSMKLEISQCKKYKKKPKMQEKIQGLFKAKK